MKLLIASDIHGAASWCRALAREIEKEAPERVVLLGDLLYHGPRNDLPDDYAPKEVIAILNSMKDQIISVRGNCEAEVDQMVLEFPCMGDYDILWDSAAENPVTHAQGTELFFTHGHVWGPGIHNSIDHMPSLPEGSALVYGHTHKKVAEPAPGNPSIFCFNPGSVGIPKDGTHSFGIYEDGHFEHRILEQESR